MAKNSLPNKNFSKRRGARRNNKAQGRKGGKNQGSAISGPTRLGSDQQNHLQMRSMPLFPPKFKGMLRYAESFGLATTSGAVNSYVYSCNGLFDPNITGTGHQPAGFDQMMLSYEHYCVLRSRIFVSFLNTSGNAYPTCAVSIRAGTTPVTVIQQIVEDGMVITQRLAGANAFPASCLLKTACDVAKFGGKVKLVDDPEYQGTIAANPAEQSYFHIQTWSIDATTANVSVEVTIEYEAIFSEPRNLSQSLRTAMHRALLIEEKSGSSLGR